jgi:predicted DsbA family dithiol-disulfide isomerase
MGLPTIELYSDVHCPWAYMALFRLRKIWPEYEGRVRIRFRALSLELKNKRPTPKPTLDQEALLMVRQEPDLPIQIWSRRNWEYVPTLLPAFEAVKAAAEQGDDAAWEYSWQLRRAFFFDSRTICMRWVLAEVAEEAGLDVGQFLADWDSSRFREAVIAESYHGWEELKVPGSPTFVLPGGKQVPNPGAIGVEWGKRMQVKRITPASCPDGDCLQPFRDMLEEAVATVSGGV